MRLKWVDEQNTGTRTRGLRFSYKRWQQDEPPWHFEWRHFQVHTVTWPRTPKRPSLKVQFEIKTYRTAGHRSIDYSKRYVRFGICL